MRRTLVLLALAWCAWTSGEARCAAQAARRVSDALILVQPSANQAFVSVTYNRYVPRSQVIRAFDRMRQSVGWTPGAIDVRNVDGASGQEAKSGKRDGVLTEATALLSNAVQIRERSFVLQPYVDAFADLNSFDVLFMVGKDPSFAGLRSFRSAALDVALVADGAPFQYAVDIRDHALPVPRLPLTESVAPAAPPEKDSGHSSALVRQLAAVVLCASVVALIAFMTVGRVFNRGQRPLTRRG